MEKKLAVIGVGYVGIKIALLFDKAGFSVTAYDKNAARIQSLQQQVDSNHEQNDVKNSRVFFT